GIACTCLEGPGKGGWALRLRALVRSRGIDLLHIHSPLPAAGGRLVLPGRSPRIVYTEHNIWSRYHPATRWANLLTFRSNDHVFAVSKEVARSIQYPSALRFLRLPPVEVLYHGLDPRAVAGWGGPADIRAEMGIPPDALVVGTVANLKTHKGHEYLLQAASEVRREMPKAHFVFVGQGPLEHELKLRAKRLGLDDTVTFFGYREDAPAVAGSFDVFALPSLHEGLPIALIEAMALGRPVIATRVGGIPEVITDQEHGLLVPPRDSRALAAGIVRLLKDRSESDALGRRAKERAAAFDIRTAVARTEALYEELIS
ncbi:MAG: glycosyltransferase, partial [Acidimicrobiia bacterium]